MEIPMKVLFALIPLLAASLLIFPATAAADELSATDVNGLWNSHTGGLVEFKSCGDTVCGTLEWEPQWGDTGVVPLDDKNPDEALRTRPIQGITILSGFRATNKGWRKGTFYSPWEGKSYPANVRRLDENTLRLQGCVARIFCRTFDWTRADPQAAHSVQEANSEQTPAQ